jgi:glycosyltransferase involved in cell wall biosynthesis
MGPKTSQSSSPYVSVILTSFNHSAFLRQAIESVLTQTFSDFELIIWDDCSADDSWQVISSYSDSRIRPFRNTANFGPTYGVNKAIFEICLGKFIAIHHSDDVWLPEKLMTQVSYLNEHPEVGAVFSHADAINEKGNLLPIGSHFYADIFHQQNRTRYQWLRRFLLEGNALCHPSVLIRKSCYESLGGYRNDLFQLPDFDMWIRLCSKYPIHVIQESLLMYRVLDNERNTSGGRRDSTNRIQVEQSRIFEETHKFLSSQDIQFIFPELLSISNLDRSSNRLTLSTALRLHNKQSPIVHLEHIRAIGDSLRHQEANHNPQLFKDFFNMSGEIDIFGSLKASELSSLNDQVISMNGRIDTLETELKIMRSSKSWRLTSPLRKLYSLVKSII